MFRVPRLPKWLLEASRQCQRGARGSRRWPREAKQESQRLPGDAFGDPWGLPGKALGPPWEAPRDNFGAKIDPKLDYFAGSVFESVLLKFFSDFLCFCVFTDLKDIL